MGGILAVFRASQLLLWTIRFILVIPPTPIASLKVLCNHMTSLTWSTLPDLNCYLWLPCKKWVGEKAVSSSPDLWTTARSPRPCSAQIPWKERVPPHGHGLPCPPYLGNRQARPKLACFDNIFTCILSDKLNSREGLSWFCTNTEHKWKRTWCIPLRQVTS